MIIIINKYINKFKVKEIFRHDYFVKDIPAHSLQQGVQMGTGDFLNISFRVYAT